MTKDISLPHNYTCNSYNMSHCLWKLHTMVFQGEICSPKDLTSTSVWITTSLMHLLLNWLFLFEETSVYIFIPSSSWSLPQATAGVFNLEVWTWQIFFINDLLWFFTDVWYTWWIIDPVILPVLCWYQASQYDWFLVASSLYVTLFSSHCIIFFLVSMPTCWSSVSFNRFLWLKTFSHGWQHFYCIIGFVHLKLSPNSLNKCKQTVFGLVNVNKLFLLKGWSFWWS